MGAWTIAFHFDLANTLLFTFTNHRIALHPCWKISACRIFASHGSLIQDRFRLTKYHTHRRSSTYKTTEMPTRHIWEELCRLCHVWLCREKPVVHSMSICPEFCMNRFIMLHSWKATFKPSGNYLHAHRKTANCMWQMDCAHHASSITSPLHICQKTGLQSQF